MLQRNIAATRAMFDAPTLSKEIHMSNFVTPSSSTAANKANIETLLTLANTAFASAERISPP